MRLPNRRQRSHQNSRQISHRNRRQRSDPNMWQANQAPEMFKTVTKRLLSRKVRRKQFQTSQLRQRRGRMQVVSKVCFFRPPSPLIGCEICAHWIRIFFRSHLLEIDIPATTESKDQGDMYKRLRSAGDATSPGDAAEQGQRSVFVIYIDGCVRELYVICT